MTKSNKITITAQIQFSKDNQTGREQAHLVCRNGTVHWLGSLPTEKEKEAYKAINVALASHDELLKQCVRWQNFAEANGYKDKDFHDANGAGWISELNSVVAKAGAGGK